MATAALLTIFAFAQTGQPLPSDATVNGLIAGLDLTSFRNSVGPRRSAGKHVFADYGFTIVERTSGGAALFTADRGWTMAFRVIAATPDRAQLCLIDRGLRRRGDRRAPSYDTQSALVAVRGATGRWTARQVPGGFPGCANDPVDPSDKGQAAPLPHAADPLRSAKVRAALARRYGDDGVRYRAAAVDLNGDGADEVVVHASGLGICGSGGCNLLVLTPRADGYHIVGDASVVRLPVRVLDRTSTGWHDLSVAIGGGRIAGGQVALRFDGERYPRNPTVLPGGDRTDAQTGVLLIDE